MMLRKHLCSVLHPGGWGFQGSPPTHSTLGRQVQVQLWLTCEGLVGWHRACFCTGAVLSLEAQFLAIIQCSHCFNCTKFTFWGYFTAF